MQNIVYVLLGLSDICINGNIEEKLEGVYSSRQMARKRGDSLKNYNLINDYVIMETVIDE